MSGLEIVGTIAGIVSAIVAIRNADQKAREKRRSALQAATKNLETTLLTTLDNGPPRINNEYNNDVARIGPSFSRGDGNILFLPVYIGCRYNSDCEWTVDVDFGGHKFFSCQRD